VSKPKTVDPQVAGWIQNLEKLRLEEQEKQEKQQQHDFESAFKEAKEKEGKEGEGVEGWVNEFSTQQQQGEGLENSWAELRERLSQIDDPKIRESGFVKFVEEMGEKDKQQQGGEAWVSDFERKLRVEEKR